MRPEAETEPDCDDAKLAEKLEQEAHACLVMAQTRDLAAFLYSLEPADKADGSSKKHVNDLVKVVCPSLKSKFPEGTADLKCGDVYDTINTAYKKKYVGLVPLEPCEEKRGEKNFAMIQLLTTSRTFFGYEACAPGPASASGELAA